MRFFPPAVLILSLLFACGDDDAGLPFGGACDDGCQSLECLRDARFPAGICTQRCGDATCPAGATCVSDFGADLCLSSCGDGDLCDAGYQCWRGACRPPCAVASECGDQTVCVSGNCSGIECSAPEDCGPSNNCVANRCVQDTSDAGSDAGTLDADDAPASPCGECDGICDGELCLESCIDRRSCGDLIRVCAPFAVDDDGDGTSDRAVAVCQDSNFEGVLLAGRCEADSDCETRTCYESQCTEICSDDLDCLPGHACRMVDEAGVGEYMACWYNDPTESVEEYLLMVEPAEPATLLPRAIVAVPPDALSVSFGIEQTAPATMNLGFFSLFAPDGNQLYDIADQVERGNDQPIRWTLTLPKDAIAVTIPNTTPDRVALESGRYTMIGGTFEGRGSRSRDLRVKAFIRRGMPGGELHFRVYVVPGLDFDASNAASDARLTETFERLRTIYEPANVHIVVDGYENVSGNQFSIIDTVTGDDSELRQLFRLTQPASEIVINLFLVRSIEFENNNIVGIAGSAPGPIDVHGTGNSGIVIAFDPSIAGNDGSFPGHVLGHELGHFLGLYHSTESSTDLAGGNDVLADTTFGDLQNLMHFTVQDMGGGVFNDEMSDGQAFVISRNPHAR